MTLGAAGSQYIFDEWKTKWTSIWIDEAAGNFFFIFTFLHLFCREAREEKINLRKQEPPCTIRYKEKGLNPLLS